MIDVETLVRSGAVVAAVAVVAGPYLVAQARRLTKNLWNTAKATDAVTSDDAHLVLDMARRLQAAGNKRGIELCQQLIDVLLQPAEGPKA